NDVRLVVMALQKWPFSASKLSATYWIYALKLLSPSAFRRGVKRRLTSSFFESASDIPVLTNTRSLIASNSADFNSYEPGTSAFMGKLRNPVVGLKKFDSY